MEKYNNYNPSKSEIKLLRKIRRDGTIKVENTPEIINLFKNEFLLWDTDTDTLELSEPYKNHCYAVRRERRRKLIWAVAVPLITGIVLLIIETAISQLLPAAPSA